MDFETYNRAELLIKNPSEAGNDFLEQILEEDGFRERIGLARLTSGVEGKRRLRECDPDELLGSYEHGFLLAKPLSKVMIYAAGAGMVELTPAMQRRWGLDKGHFFFMEPRMRFNGPDECIHYAAEKARLWRDSLKLEYADALDGEKLQSAAPWRALLSGTLAVQVIFYLSADNPGISLVETALKVAPWMLGAYWLSGFIYQHVTGPPQSYLAHQEIGDLRADYARQCMADFGWPALYKYYKKNKTG